MSFSRFMVACALHGGDEDDGVEGPRLVLSEDEQRSLYGRVALLGRCNEALLTRLPGTEMSALGALAFLVTDSAFPDVPAGGVGAARGGADGERPRRAGAGVRPGGGEGHESPHGDRDGDAARRRGAAGGAHADDHPGGDRRGDPRAGEPADLRGARPGDGDGAGARPGRGGGGEGGRGAGGGGAADGDRAGRRRGLRRGRPDRGAGAVRRGGHGGRLRRQPDAGPRARRGAPRGGLGERLGDGGAGVRLHGREGRRRGG